MNDSYAWLFIRPAQIIVSIPANYKVLALETNNAIYIHPG